LRALIFDAWFDAYQGVIVLCRLIDGEVKVGDKIKFMSNQQAYDVLKLGVFAPFAQSFEALEAGEVGYFICGIKNIRDVKVGDTITNMHRPTDIALPGFKQIKPMVYSGIYPVASEDYVTLKDALEKLCLNDSSLTYEPETSAALGFGCRCGYLGLLHMEIVQERLEREFNLELITTAPSVVYWVTETGGETRHIENPAALPDPTKILKIEEPYIKAMIHTPSTYIGGILKLCEDKRGRQIKMEYISDSKVIIEYELPLNEMVMDFYDKLKTVSKGYASLDYEFMNYQESDMVKLDILINNDPVDALSLIVHRSKAYARGRELTKKLKELIPRQNFQVALQAAVGSKIVARETIGALRKDVTAKCYGGDISRKRKLLERQKEGKKRMKQIGTVDVPQEAFLAILKVEE